MRRDILRATAWFMALLSLGLACAACSSSDVPAGGPAREKSAEAAPAKARKNLSSAKVSEHAAGRQPEALSARLGSSVRLTSLKFDPPQPVTGDRIRAVIGVSDPQGSGGYSFAVRWNINGVDVEKTGETLEEPVTFGDSVMATVLLSVPGEEPKVLSSTVLVGNAPPMLEVVQGQGEAPGEYVAHIHVNDPEGDSVSLQLLEGPEGLVLDSAARTLRWRPSGADSGVFAVALEGVDSAGNSCRYQFDITVAPSRERARPAEVARQ